MKICNETISKNDIISQSIHPKLHVNRVVLMDRQLEEVELQAAVLGVNISGAVLVIANDSRVCAALLSACFQSENHSFVQ